ncbi:helix-turn-helix domain-containing protein [Runella limosa]|uniref:helix-turn-helix domain-containing protein n=1 Tax=Runella limosa TaxID=370978 RepID=UPI0004246EE7|nr:helix-turn-helix transcriptional regulator [Runella limosa]
MNISLNIRKLREANRLTQNDIAERLGIDGSNYAKQEKRGNKLSIEQVEKIADALGVSMKVLIFGDKEDNNQILVETKLEQVKKLTDLNDQYLHTIKVLTEILEDFKKHDKEFKDNITSLKSALLNDLSRLEKIELSLKSMPLESVNCDTDEVTYRDTLLLCCQELKAIYNGLVKSIV